MMAGFTSVLLVFCAAGCGLSRSSPVLRPAQMFQTGQNVSLSCSLNSSLEVTWFLLRWDQLQPLFTVSKSKLNGNDVVNHHAGWNPRISSGGELDRGLVLLEITGVEEEDAGLYFCSGRCSGGNMCFNRGIHLTVDGVDGSRNQTSWQPCWSLGFCLLPGLLATGFVAVVGFYLCSGKPAVCCCRRRQQDVTQEESLHYSSLNHPHKPRPSSRGGAGFDNVTYSTVANQMAPNASRDL
ncbi:uncharacterized protein LOC125020590 [Mugil cephalus]|uniref:uncharacterized protein LOC125020590 n=1 Tax=Mugil cephalus TaxID=48193 RepID=UPI001FB7AA26|nr:uncharacterized protein LOC125020590 [Mugil cephalus]